MFAIKSYGSKATALPSKQLNAHEEVSAIRQARLSLFAHTFAHFCVDFACFFIAFGGLYANEADLQAVATGFLLYNAIAFGLQFIIGYFADTHPGFPAAPIGAMLVFAALFMLQSPLLALVFCAFGNASFHVGGGIDSLKLAGGKMGRSGVFVSSGALGVSLGTMLGRAGAAFSYIPIALIACSILLLLFFGRSRLALKNDPGFQQASGLPVYLVIGLALLSIVIRSFVGSRVPIAWERDGWLIVLPSVAAFLGKLSGGFIADRFGARGVGVSSLLLSLPLLLFGKGIMVLSLLGLFLFNMTMPIALCIVASKLGRYYGLSFGLTTLALLLGNIPVFFFSILDPILTPLLAGLILLSGACIFTAAKGRQERIQHAIHLDS